jgi:uncharacterized protein (DUF1330 family)
MFRLAYREISIPETEWEELMSAYFLIDVQEITDDALMAEYRRRVFPVVEQFGGKYRVIGGEQYVLEGDWKATFPVIIEFETLEAARR